jgi:multisubunit Na+/H+ antiporter MnhF subunit
VATFYAALLILATLIFAWSTGYAVYRLYRGPALADRTTPADSDRVPAAE